MNRQELVARYRELQSECTEMVALWLLDHPKENTAALCRELEPDDERVAENLRHRVQRAKKRLQAIPSAGSSSAPGGSRTRADRQVAEATLTRADDEQVQQIVASLPPEAVERLATKATDRLIENARSRQSEHQTEPTMGEALGGEKLDLALADTLVIRANRNQRELADLVQREGLRIGALGDQETLKYAEETEKLAAEFRAAAQERVRDQAVAR